MKETRTLINYSDSCLTSVLPLDAHQENRFRSTEVLSREVVTLTTVDDFLCDKRIDTVDLLKVDTQGFDLQVLRGAGRALGSGALRNVLVELNFVRMYEGQGSPREIHDFLDGYGFHLVDYYEKYRQGHTLAWCTALFSRRWPST
jgi:hypothetical protein